MEEPEYIYGPDYFIVIYKDATTLNVKAECQICGAVVRGNSSSRTNFGDHLKTHHPEINEKRICDKEKKKKLSPSEIVEETFYDLVVTENLPLQLVQNSKLKNLIQGLKKNIILKDENEFMEVIQSKFFIAISEIKGLLNLIENMSLTISISFDNYVYSLFITVYWINDENYGQKNLILRYRKFMGSLCTQEVIGELKHIYTQFGFDDKKIVQILISCQNATYDRFINFPVDTNKAIDDGLMLLPEAFSRKLLKEVENSNENFSKLVMISPDLTILELAKNFINGLNPHENMHRRVMVKCLNLKYEKTNGYKIPDLVNFTSHVEMLQVIVKEHDNFKTYYGASNSILLSNEELNYLRDILTFLNIFKNAFNYLRKNFYLGYFLVTMNEIKEKLEKIELLYFRDSFKQNFVNNFQVELIPILNIQICSPNLVLATVSHPRFKLDFFPKNNWEKIKQICLDEAAENISAELHPDSMEVDSEEFLSRVESQENSVIIEKKISTFFLQKRKKTFDDLNQNLLIKKIFVKFNSGSNFCESLNLLPLLNNDDGKVILLKSWDMYKKSHDVSS